MNWQDIVSAPKDGTVLLLWSADWVDEDFNHTGIVEGFWSDDDGWITCIWDAYQDEYCTARGYLPSKWALMIPPESITS